ncbi:MAG: hypothetical protein HWE20_16460 [Gammaproteobacteria bacterium]|nr:hypothetical protein [Gammaproteobacteria bacterium]
MTLRPILGAVAALFSAASFAADCTLDATSDAVHYGEQPRVYVGQSTTAIAGIVVDQQFVPKFALSADVKYRVEANECENAYFQLEKAAQPAPQVSGIYPLGDALPENILRFYIQFDRPMREGNFLDYIRLHDLSLDEDLTGVFFDNQYELWSKDRKQLTLLVDPGRVKTGLQAHNAQGRAFIAGRQYRLTVLESWRGLDGQPLQARYSKVFTATPEVMHGIDARTWQLNAPATDSTQPLVIQTDRAVDHMSIQSYLFVIDDQGKELPGVWRLLAPTQIEFKPQMPWQEQPHSLQINARFEDVVGNNLNGAFDHEKGSLHQASEGFWINRPVALAKRQDR